MKQEYQEIALSRIRPNSWNPRKNFAGEKFDELVKSISEVGVIEPILIRPMTDTQDYEIVFGERRWRAACTAAEQNGGIDRNAIPALIRELTDDEAFDLTTIENLQREDLNELEEANGFQAYVDRHGEDSIPILAERIGINPRYIRRRMALLKLPKKVLAAWGDGKIKYGHLEQLARLKDKQEIIEYLQKLTSWAYYPVATLKNDIDRQAPDLKHALFDTSQCETCSQNSDIQRKLFGEDVAKRHCLNPKCFKKKQNDWLLSRWEETEHYKKHKTRGFRFRGDVDWNKYETIYEKSFLKTCGSCNNFVTLLEITGKEYGGKVCLNPHCYHQMEKAEATGESKPKKKKDAPRVAWHGEHFREKFYQQALPARFEPLPPDDLKVQRLLLFALVRSHRDLAPWFADRHQVKNFNKEGYDFTGFSPKLLWQVICRMPVDQIKAEIKAFTVQICMKSFCADDRQAMAENVEIDLSKEWKLTEEYLQKKTVAEMMDMGEKLGIFADPKAQNFLYEILMKKRGSFKSCKKKELIRVILESGVDLAGKVPAEILSIDK